MRAMFVGDFICLRAIQVETHSRFFHALQVAQRIGMNAKRSTQSSAADIRALCNQLLVYAYRQWLETAEDGKFFLKFLEQGACGLKSVGCGFGSRHEQQLNKGELGCAGYHDAEILPAVDRLYLCL